MKRLTFTCLLTFCIVAMALAVTKSQVVVYINGQRYYIHTVESKETIYSIAKTYGVSEQTIIDLNSSELKAGENIKIPYETTESEKKEKKSAIQSLITFSKHKVKKGETLYSISRQYEISIETIMEDNPTVDPIALPEGHRLLIRKKAVGRTSEKVNQAEWKEYQADLNLTTEADGYQYHIVQHGETIYSLAKQGGVSESEFIELNSLNDGLKAGSIVKIPVKLSASIDEDDDDIYAEEDEIEIEVEHIQLRSLRYNEKLKIALFLPLSIDGKANRQFADFYKGFEMGLAKVQEVWGRNIEVTLYNTERKLETVEQILQSEEFRGTNLIVGPVYEELLSPVIRYAEITHTPVVSPLASLKESRSNILFQMAPPAESRFEKVEQMLDNTKHVTLIYTDQTDTQFEENIMAIMGDRPYDKHIYVYEHPNVVAEKVANEEASTGDLSPFINNDKDNTIVVMASNETDVDRILSALSSAQINIVARGGRAPRYEVLGNSEWSRYKNIDRTIMFKNNVTLISSYQAKRDNEVVRKFDSDYIERHDAMPSLYTYRGFDTAMIFGEGIYSDMDYNLEGRSFTPLQSPYRFKVDPHTGIHTNIEWIRVNYKNNYTIIIE
ncbi:MAG: LysM peptidoglycan-binding domain-containing protein [Rikenellaceae bacterium]